ncbi:MAG: cytochrome c oxidase assembly factor Coa1 family protein [Bryobacteraceae bacterium]
MATNPVFNQPPKNWFLRHLGWTIAGGCSIALAGVVLFVSLIVVFVFGLLRNSDATKLALERAQSNATVVERLGRPLETGWIISGNINTSGPSGHAEMEIPVHGNKGKGTIYVVADKTAGLWTFSTLEVAFADGAPRVNLLEPLPDPAR